MVNVHVDSKGRVVATRFDDNPWSRCSSGSTIRSLPRSAGFGSARRLGVKASIIAARDAVIALSNYG